MSLPELLTARTAWRGLLVALVALGLGACASDNDKDFRTDVTKLYERARTAMDNGNYRNAIVYYEALEARYPFSNEGKQSQLDLIYCHFKNGNRESAIEAATQFERENPTHPRLDYALYMRGLAAFKGQSNFFFRLLRVDLSRRPPDRAMESFSAFAQLLQRFPTSPYAADARQRMILLCNRMAEHENHVARYYLERGAYMAALNRAKYATETYNGAPAVAESLRIMVDAYRALDMNDLAASTRSVLAQSYPEAASAQAQAEKKAWYQFW